MITEITIQHTPECPNAALARDRFAPRTGAPAFACRTYATEAGSIGVPSVEQIVDALTAGEGS
ncbi:MAG: hypothetical protein ACRDYZ_07045 [Acidimicrobiales bacterium]